MKTLLHQSKKIKQKAFTLLELLVVMAVLMVVLGIIVGASRELRVHSNLVFCMNNLRQISVAMVTYYNDYKDYPPGLPYNTLSDQLSRYLSSKKVFVCPQDDSESEDSYSQFYTYPGQDAGGGKYIIGCPRHKRGSMCASVFGFQTSYKSKVATVKIDGEILRPGSSSSGTMNLEDGTTVSSSDIEMYLVQSIRMADGTLYTIVRVPDGETGSLSVDATKGTQLEIITPALIAAVRGTHFTVDVQYEGDTPYTSVSVQDGMVDIQPVNGLRMINNQLVAAGRRGMRLRPGESTQIYSDPPSVNRKAINKRVENLQKQINRGLAHGKNMNGEVSLLKWLMGFSSAPVSFDMGSNDEPYEFPGRYNSVADANQGASHAVQAANSEKDKVTVAKDFIKNVANDLAQTVHDIEKDADTAQREADKVESKLSKNQLDQAQRALQDAQFAAQEAEQRAALINQQLQAAQQAKVNADRAVAKAREYADYANRAADQANSIAMNDPNETNDPQQVRDTAQRASEEVQQALQEADLAASELNAAILAAQDAQEAANSARASANQATQMMNQYDR